MQSIPETFMRTLESLGGIFGSILENFPLWLFGGAIMTLIMITPDRGNKGWRNSNRNKQKNNADDGKANNNNNNADAKANTKLRQIIAGYRQKFARQPAPAPIQINIIANDANARPRLLVGGQGAEVIDSTQSDPQLTAPVYPPPQHSAPEHTAPSRQD